MRSGSAWQIIYGTMALGLLGCSNDPNGPAPPPEYQAENNERIRQQYGTVWGDDETLFQRGTGRFERTSAAPPAIPLTCP